MAGVTAKIALQIFAELEGTGDLGNPAVKNTVFKEVKFIPGTDTTGKADVMFSDTRTLNASATEDLDLTGSLTNAFGATIAQAEVVALYIAAADTNTNNVLVGNATTNGFVGPIGATGVLTLKPGEFVCFTSQTGWAVTAGTGDLLKVANSAGGTSVKYSILIIGRTVAA